MGTQKKADRSRIRRLITRYGFLVIVSLAVANIGMLYAARLKTLASTCFTEAQVQSDQRCLYILDSRVYQKGSRSKPHHGHPCGSDVTSFIPSFHVEELAKYIDPNYVGDICVALPTAVPPTAVPPTRIPPTDIPPTNIPGEIITPTTVIISVTPDVISPTATPSAMIDAATKSKIIHHANSIIKKVESRKQRLDKIVAQIRKKSFKNRAKLLSRLQQQRIALENSITETKYALKAFEDNSTQETLHSLITSLKSVVGNQNRYRARIFDVLHDIKKGHDSEQKNDNKKKEEGDEK